MGFSLTHLLIVLVIVVLVFGTSKLKTIGSDMGGAIKGFRDAMKDGDKPAEGSKPLDKPDNDSQKKY